MCRKKLHKLSVHISSYGGSEHTRDFGGKLPPKTLLTSQCLMLLLFYLSLSSRPDDSAIGSFTLSRCPQVYSHTRGVLSTASPAIHPHLTANRQGGLRGEDSPRNTPPAVQQQVASGGFA